MKHHRFSNFKTTSRNGKTGKRNIVTTLCNCVTASHRVVLIVLLRQTL